LNQDKPTISNGMLWLEKEGTGPLVATAIHSGHEISRDLLPMLALDESTRAREEDPYTDSWIKVVPSRIAFKRSHFEVDLNRPAEEGEGNIANTQQSDEDSNPD
jgi:N-formylglutamate amidohydrolase